MKTGISDNILRLESWEKVTGRAKYSLDLTSPDKLCARVLTSPHAHALIRSIDISGALSIPGVKTVVCGKDFPQRTGALIADFNPVAIDRVRYAGEVVAIVVATDEASALAALEKINVDYIPLPFVITPSQALASAAPLVHEQLGSYKALVTSICPVPGTNIASHYHIRKGDAESFLRLAEVSAEESFFLPASDHAAMEVRTASAEISPDGEITVTACSQAPHEVQERIAEYFGVPAGKVRVKVPYVGGAFGGKVPVTVELLACMASKAVGGRPVSLIITREEDISTAPSRLSLEATIRLGATRDGRLTAAAITYRLDCGAFADIAPNMAMAMASNCTGPYNIENLSCDALCVYTNRTFATSFRGFGHESYLFCVERAMDTLAAALGISPIDLRLINAIKPGQLTPTQIECTLSNMGDVSKCLENIKVLSNWDEGQKIQIDERTVRAKGVACLWKAANPPSNAISGAFLSFNADGSVNLNTGVVEMGSGDLTRLSQMLADRFSMDIAMVHILAGVDTRAQPKHWKTVASLSEFLAGTAVMRAADDALEQIRKNASLALKCPLEDIVISDAKAFKKSNPNEFKHFKDLVHGYKSPEGTSMGDPVLSKGGFMLKGLSTLDPATGKGKPSPAWTVGAQVVEIELDTKEYTFRIINASTVMDVGALVNPDFTAAIIKGGMSMGLSLASRECFSYSPAGVMNTPNFRTYKLLHIGQEPDYRVGFVETPQNDSPFGTRSFTEHGILGMPAALGNALSTALGIKINTLPITPEVMWKIAGGQNDSK